MYQWCKENLSTAESLVQALKQKQRHSKSVWFSAPFKKVASEQTSIPHHVRDELIDPISRGSSPLGKKVLKPDDLVVVQSLSVDREIAKGHESANNPSRKRKASECESDDTLSLPSEKKVKVEGCPGHDDGVTLSSNSKEVNVAELQQVGKKLTDKDVSPNRTQVTLLNSVTLNTALKVKEAWTNAQRVSETEMAIFTCSTVEMTELCDVIGLSDFNEASLSVACDNLISFATGLSYANTFCFLERALAPKLCRLSKPASRVLSDVLYHLVLSFPQQILEGVLLSCLLQNEMNKHLSELLLKLVKNDLPLDIRKQFLVKILGSCLSLNEFTMVLVQVLLEYNMALEDKDIVHLMSLCEYNSATHQSSLKFGKFLMSVVTRYRKQLSQAQLATMHHLIESHKSFLKKSLLAALNKN